MRASSRKAEKITYAQKKKSETERKLHNQKSQQAVINGPYIFKTPKTPPETPLVWALPCLSPHSTHTASRRRSKQVPGLSLSLANIRPECHMRRPTGRWEPGEAASSKTLNLSHEREKMRIVNCMRHANLGRGQLITHRFARSRACASFAFDGRGHWPVELS